mmetsp:Transcript_27092/g.19530  ORF Transcript_27092/g.19530 Transcript_27092/m.19530 type:complete len:82 (+) Transcript_27092:82-327(+)
MNQPDQDEEMNADKDFSIRCYDTKLRAYGVVVDNLMFLSTLVDLPCIIEAQKTLDYNTFYKSADAAQMLYVHNVCIDDVST